MVEPEGRRDFQIVFRLEFKDPVQGGQSRIVVLSLDLLLGLEKKAVGLDGRRQFLGCQLNRARPLATTNHGQGGKRTASQRLNETS